MNNFKTPFAEDIFNQKYSHDGKYDWEKLCEILVMEVCGNHLHRFELDRLTQYMQEMKFIPAGRYLYYAGRPVSFYNNCFAMRSRADTREEWANLVQKAMSALMCGGGVGNVYSSFREKGAILSRTGGIASGPIPLMKIMNEAGRHVMQGGSRRSALWGGLHWWHPDQKEFIYSKNWSEEVKAMKLKDFNFPADLDMTNISTIYDDAFLAAMARGEEHAMEIWMLNILQALKTAEPGMSFNFGGDADEDARNACTEFTSCDDSDVCNLGSVNFGEIKNIDELMDVSYLASKFLVCGGFKADLPYEKVKQTRSKNRSIGMGLMGLHEWLLSRGHKYEMNAELASWLLMWGNSGELGANEISDQLSINRPRKYRAIAPTGTIGILASTTTGIEPLYAVAYKRRYLYEGTNWKHQYVIDATAERLIQSHGLNPSEIDTAATLASNPEQRIKMQYDVQRFVDMAISSTINLPSFEEQSFTPEEFSDILLKYIHGLRGLTVYPDGCRGGQPLTPVDYHYAKGKEGMVFDEVEDKCIGGLCGI